MNWWVCLSELVGVLRCEGVGGGMRGRDSVMVCVCAMVCEGVCVCVRERSK